MNVRDQINRFGYQKTISDILQRIAYRIIKGELFYYFELPSDAIHKIAFNTAALPYSFGFLGIDQLLTLRIPEDMEVDHAFLEQAFAKGNKCFGVIDGDILAHFSWYATSPTHVVGNLKFQFPRDKVYMFNAFTSNRYRGKKLYPLAVTQAVKSYIDKGFIGALTIINANNYSSISAVEQIGFSPIGKLYVSSAGRSYVYASNGCTSNGVSLVRFL